MAKLKPTKSGRNSRKPLKPKALKIDARDIKEQFKKLDRDLPLPQSKRQDAIPILETFYQEAHEESRKRLAREMKKPKPNLGSVEVNHDFHAQKVMELLSEVALYFIDREFPDGILSHSRAKDYKSRDVKGTLTALQDLARPLSHKLNDALASDIYDLRQDIGALETCVEELGGSSRLFSEEIEAAKTRISKARQIMKIIVKRANRPSEIIAGALSKYDLIKTGKGRKFAARGQQAYSGLVKTLGGTREANREIRKLHRKIKELGMNPTVDAETFIDRYRLSKKKYEFQSRIGRSDGMAKGKSKRRKDRRPHEGHTK